MKFSGARVTEARVGAGLSKSDLAFAVRRLNPDLRPDASAISKIERGDHEPKANLLAAIATATGRDIDFFYEAEGDDAEAEELVAALRARATKAAAHRRIGEAVEELVELDRGQVPR